MHDYALKLWEALGTTRKIQRVSMQHLMTTGTADGAAPSSSLYQDFEQTAYQVPASPLPLRLTRPGERVAVLVFNPLAESARRPLTVFVQSPHVCVEDADGNAVPHQVNPTWNASGFFRLDVSFLQVTFVAKLKPLAIAKFVVSRCDADDQRKRDAEQTQVYCLRCPKNPQPAGPFSLSPKPDGAVQLENAEMVLLFDETTHLLRSVTHKRTGKTEQLDLEFNAYSTAQFRSGAYLLKINSNAGESEKLAVFGQEDLVECVVVSGPVYSEVTLVFESGQSKQEPGRFTHTVRLYHTK